jgi:hypothetical protein
MSELHVAWAYAINESVFIGVFDSVDRMQAALKEIINADPSFTMHYLLDTKKIEVNTNYAFEAAWFDDVE